MPFKGSVGLIGVVLFAACEVRATTPGWSAHAAAAASAPTDVSSERYAPLAGPPEIRLPGGGDVRVELAFVDSEGHILRRLTAAGEPVHVTRTAQGKYLVSDAKTPRIFEVTTEGDVTWSWNPARSDLHDLISAQPLPSGNILVSAGYDGLLEVNRDHDVIWSLKIQGRYTRVLSAVRLTDGSTLFTIEQGEHPLYRVAAGETQYEPLEVPAAFGSLRHPYCVPWRRSLPSRRGSAIRASSLPASTLR